MDVWEYFEQKRAEWRGKGVEPDKDNPFEVEAGSDGQRGRVFCNLHLNDDSYLAVYERVVVKGTGITRLIYAYSLIIDGAHAHGWAREPGHDLEVHEHEGEERTRLAAKPIALCDCIDLAWEIASEQAEALTRED